jgi:hypothetical protein
LIDYGIFSDGDGAGIALTQLKEIFMQGERMHKNSLILLVLMACLGTFIHFAAFCYAADDQQHEIVVNVNCSDENFITLGYKYGSGANPYTLKGKCIKMHNVQTFQYFGKDKALARWHYRGEHGVVYLEAPEGQELLGDSRVVIGMCVGVYSYTSAYDTPSQIPHIIVVQ